MPEEQYQWMLGLAAAWLQKARRDFDDDGPSGPRVERIVGVAGRLSGLPLDSANEQFALVILLLWIYWIACAKTGANFGVNALSACKINAAPFFPGPWLQAMIPQGLAQSHAIPAFCANTPASSHNRRHGRTPK